MKLHKFDALSFVSGVVITGIGLLFLLPAEPDALFDWLGDVGSWFWPVAFLALGAVVLVPLLFKSQDEPEEL